MSAEQRQSDRRSSNAETRDLRPRSSRCRGHVLRWVGVLGVLAIVVLAALAVMAERKHFVSAPEAAANDTLLDW